MAFPSDRGSENTPLLDATDQHEQVYLRFRPAKKRAIVAIVSGTGLLALFVSGTFIPSIPQIAKDLHSTPPIVTLAMSFSILATSIGALTGATYSGFYGRRPVYLVGTPLLVIGSVGAATAQSVTSLIIWRFIQAFGASPGLAVGSGVIGDIYKLEERGQAIGVFFGAILAGPAIAPLIGGMATYYFSWRVLQLGLGVLGLLVFVIVLLFFPETYHPGQRGVEKADPLTLPVWRPVLLNVFQPLWILRSPNLLAVTLGGYTALLTDYGAIFELSKSTQTFVNDSPKVLLIPLAYTIGEKYGIPNEALVGACFLPAGIGNTIGAPWAGHIADRTVIKYRRKRGGEWYPEDRLRATYLGALVLVPLSVLLSGITTHYVDGKLGLTINLGLIFLNGIGVDFVLSPEAAYFVDLMHSRSAETMAACNGLRAMLISLTVSGIIPSIEKYGVLATNAASAVLAWIGFALIVVTIRYGDRLRAVVDVGFSTAENN